MEIKRRAVTTREQWLQWRRAYLCASELGAVCGVDEYRTALSVYAEKSGMIQNQPDSPLMRRGRNFERAALTYLGEDYPDWRIQQPNVFLFEDDHRLGATPDAIAETPDHVGLVNVQIKTIALPSFEKWEGRPPMSYTLQVACENMMLDADHGILAVLAVGNYTADLHVFDIPRHAGAEERICEIADEFWANMAAGKMPAPDYRRDAETISALYPEGTAESIDLSTDNLLGEILDRREMLKAQIGENIEEVEAINAEIRHKLGEHERAEFPGWRITLKEQVRKEYIVPASVSRVLRVTREKDK